MSYGGGPPQGNPNYYGGPPPGQSGYGPPPGQFNQGPFPPQQQHQHHQQGGFPPQGGYGGPPPQGQYPPQQGGFGGPPPPGQFPPQHHQQQGGFGGPPPGPFPPPQQGGFGGPPPPGQGYGGAPPPQALPSTGYDPHAAAQGDASADADALRGAMKGFGTNEAILIKILSKPDPLQMALLRNTYSTRIQRNLEHDVASETSSHFKEGLVALVRGPLMQDVHNIRKAIKGAGTKESVLNDVLLARSNADMNAIKHAYQLTFHSSVETDVKDDLSGKTSRLFGMVMAAHRADESAPIIPQDLDRDCAELHRATEGKVGTDQITVCNVLATRSDGQLRALAHAYQTKYHIALVEVLRKEFGGHMQDALLLMAERALDRAMTDAVQIEETMKGVGTREDMLVHRVVRVHWDRAHLDQVRRAYLHRYKRELVARVRGETRGDLEKLLVACLEG